METIFLKLLQCHGIKLKLIKLIRLRQEGGNQYQQLIFPYIIPPSTTTTTLLGVFQDKKSWLF